MIVYFHSKTKHCENGDHFFKTYEMEKKIEDPLNEHFACSVTDDGCPLFLLVENHTTE
jgi:hypothetical protein